MNQQLTRSKTPTVPQRDLSLEAATKHVVAWMPSDPTKPMGLTRSLTEHEKDRIRKRIAELQTVLAERNSQAVDRAINAMMLSFPSGRASGQEAEAVVAAYGYVLGDLPPWSVSEAVKRFARGQVPGVNPAFPPSGAEVHDEAEKVLAPWRAELMRWERTLAGEVMEKINPMSREQRLELESHREAEAAREWLRNNLIAMGKDPDELDKTPNAPPRDSDMKRLSK